MKAGDILENYQGAFAKVLKVQEEGGLYTLSAWVRTREQAEMETVGVTTLNSFGLSQVVKGGDNTPGAKAAETSEEAPKVTSKVSKKEAE